MKKTMTNIAELCVKKAVDPCKTEIKSIQKLYVRADTLLKEGLEQKINDLEEKAAHELRLVEKDIKDSIRRFQIQRARDKADADRQH